LTTGDLGGLVVPQYLVDRVRSSGHSLRPFCDATAVALPERGNTVDLMRVTTGATPLTQTAENVAVTDSTVAITDNTLPVRTVYVGMPISMQGAYRSDKAAFDLLVARELVGAIDAKQETLVLNGDGTSGTPTGLLNVSGIGSIALTDTSTSALLDSVGRAAQQATVATGRPADTVVMHPRRWWWLTSHAGDQAAAIQVATTPGPIAGRMLGLDVIASPSMPTTLSTNQDAVLVVHRDEVYVGEGAERIEMQRDAANQASSLQVRVMVSRYYATGIDRPAGVVKITGAGLANPYA